MEQTKESLSFASSSRSPNHGPEQSVGETSQGLQASATAATPVSAAISTAASGTVDALGCAAGAGASATDGAARIGRGRASGQCMHVVRRPSSGQRLPAAPAAARRHGVYSGSGATLRQQREPVWSSRQLRHPAGWQSPRPRRWCGCAGLRGEYSSARTPLCPAHGMHMVQHKQPWRPRAGLLRVDLGT